MTSVYLRAPKIPASSIDPAMSGSSPNTTFFLKHVLSTITSSTFFGVAIFYSDPNFLGVKSGCSDWPHLRELSKAERMEEFSRHRLEFKGLHEVHKTRAFQPALLAGARGRVGEYPVWILEEVVAEEKARVGFDGFPPIRWCTIRRGLVLTIENRCSTGRDLPLIKLTHRGVWT